MSKREKAPARARTARYPSDLADRFMLRLPNALRDQIHVVARKNCRSANGEIIYRLIKSFEAEGFTLPDPDEDTA